MDEESPLRAPVRASLFEAASQIEAASRGPATSGWPEATASALKLAASAVESSLDDLAVAGGALHAARRDEPWLARRLRKVEQSLDAVLVDVWEATATSHGTVTPTFAGRLAALSEELRTLASATFDLTQRAVADSPSAND